MNDRKFLNQTQPQTLVIATLLLYLNAFFAGLLVFQYNFAHEWTVLATAVFMAAGAFGIANEKKWGYGLAVAGAILNLALALLLIDASFLSLIFDVALVLLLLHPMSRDYQRIWFR
ncbi:MAG: hypothetical protein M5U31_13470 [Acidimicrobiia bacterium]|nr:hypothetical protein [Acidimicrobiia bacterium]